MKSIIHSKKRNTFSFCLVLFGIPLSKVGFNQLVHFTKKYMKPAASLVHAFAQNTLKVINHYFLLHAFYSYKSLSDPHRVHDVKAFFIAPSFEK